MADKTLAPWSERNKIINVYKMNGKKGWMHLIVAEEIKTGNKFLRLKRHLNWFKIPDAYYYTYAEGMLKKGADELGWTVDGSEKIKIEEVKDKQEIEEIVKSSSTNEELFEIIEDNPKIVERILKYCSTQRDITYLSDFLEIMGQSILKSNERFRVAFKEIIEKMSQEKSEKGLQELSDLMGEWNLFQIVSLTNIVKYRLGIIRTFEQMIHNEKTYEINTDNSIHRVLEKNMWLINENYFVTHSNKSLRTFIGDEITKKHKEYKKLRLDFAAVDTNNELIILEIKRPSIPLTKKEIDQIELYLRISKQYKQSSYGSLKGYLIGKKITQEAYETMDFRKNIKLMTYNELIDNCKKRYTDYLKVIEED